MNLMILIFLFLIIYNVSGEKISVIILMLIKYLYGLICSFVVS